MAAQRSEHQPTSLKPNGARGHPPRRASRTLRAARAAGRDGLSLTHAGSGDRGWACRARGRADLPDDCGLAAFEVRLEIADEPVQEVTIHHGRQVPLTYNGGCDVVVWMGVVDPLR